MSRPLTPDDCRPDVLVLCVDDRPSPQPTSRLVQPWLRAHNVYRVRGPAAGLSEPGVLLEEARACEGWEDYQACEPGFALNRFRVIDESAIDHLRALLGESEGRRAA